MGRCLIEHENRMMCLHLHTAQVRHLHKHNTIYEKFYTQYIYLYDS